MSPRFRLLLLGLALPLLAVAALPWWLGAGLRALGPAVGVTFGAYERLGYSRFAVTAAVYEGHGVQVRAARLEADTPLRWLVRRVGTQPGPVAVGPWSVTVSPLPASPHPTPGGWAPLRARLRSIVAALRTWLPQATLGAGEIRWPGGQLALAAAQWTPAGLAVHGFAWGGQAADLTLVPFPEGDDTLRLTAAAAGQPFALTIVSQANQLTGTARAWDQSLPLAATFAETGWLPQTATLEAPALDVAGHRIRGGAAYARVHGAGRVEWRERQLSGQLTLQGEPAAGQAVPPLAVDLRGSGTTDRLQLDALRVTLPGVEARLDRPLVYHRGASLRAAESHFTLTADLAQWPGASARGKIDGEARLTARPDGQPLVTFSLAARDLGYGELRAEAATAAGRLDWPQLELSEATVRFNATESLTARGGWDWATGTLRETSLTAHLARPTLAPWLPAALEWTEGTLEARAAGPLDRLEHTGTLRVAGLRVAPLQPVDLELAWQGRGRDRATLTATAIAGATTLALAATVAPQAATLTAFSLARTGQPTLALRQPATVSWHPTLALDSLQLSDGTLSLTAAGTFGETGRLDLAVRALPSSLFADLIVLRGPAWRIEQAAANGTWAQGPLIFTGDLLATLDAPQLPRVSLALTARGDATGLTLEQVRVLDGATVALQASGQLPLTLHPGRRDWIELAPDAPLTLDATTEPAAAFWAQLQELAGLTLEAPRVVAHLGGSWHQPTGYARIDVQRLALDPTRLAQPVPALDGLSLRLAGTAGGLTLETFSATLDGQRVQASGHVPIAPGQWNRARTAPLALLKESGEWHVEIPDAEVAALARYLPDYLAPQGRLHLDLKVRPGLELAGTLRLRDAGSQPLGPLGALREVNADLRLAGRTLTLDAVNALLGGQVIALSGEGELPADGAPRFDLRLRGTNLPLVRQMGLLVRGDLDLTLQTAAAGRPRLGGTVRLHDSLFLSDVRDLLPSGGRGGTTRAPYFQVTAAPFNRWRLDVAIEGERFLRLRTPLFTGVASARFKLDGTLGAPRALGEITINEGKVLLPFAAFDVQQGTVRLSEENPAEPQLWLTGVSRRYDYDLRMELSGAVSAPVLAFSSSPPLDSRQLLLLVMAGEPPGDGATGVSDRARVARLGTYLGQSLLGALGGDATGADKLTLSTGERITRQGRETYHVEYRLDDRWSLVGEYDEFDGYNAGIKWRIYTVGGRDDHATP